MFLSHQEQLRWHKEQLPQERFKKDLRKEMQISKQDKGKDNFLCLLHQLTKKHHIYLRSLAYLKKIMIKYKDKESFTTLSWTESRLMRMREVNKSCCARFLNLQSQIQRNRIQRVKDIRLCDSSYTSKGRAWINHTLPSSNKD